MGLDHGIGGGMQATAGGLAGGLGREGMQAVAEGEGRGGEREFSAWRGELADAERQKEVEYDGQQLVDAMIPLGRRML